MTREVDDANGSAFFDIVPTCFDGHSDYATYREYGAFWTKLDSLSCNKHGQSINVGLQGEAKPAAKTISPTERCGRESCEMISQRLDKAYKIGKTNKVDTDLADSFDYRSKNQLGVEHFVSGSTTSVDEISKLSLDDKLKGHLLLHQASLTQQKRHVVIAAASGSYDVHRMSLALKNIYRKIPPSVGTSHLTNRNHQYTHGDTRMKRRVRHRRERERGHRKKNKCGKSNASHCPTYYSFKRSARSTVPNIIIDIGASSSVAGKETLDDAMRCLNLDRVEDTNFRQLKYRFDATKMNSNIYLVWRRPFIANVKEGTSETILIWHSMSSTATFHLFWCCPRWLVWLPITIISRSH